MSVHIKGLLFFAAVILVGLCVATFVSGGIPFSRFHTATPTALSLRGLSTAISLPTAPSNLQPIPPSGETLSPTNPAPTNPPLPTQAEPTVALAPTPAPTNPPSPTSNAQPTPQVNGGLAGKWDLIFWDDFHETQLDPKSWVTCYYWDNHGCTNSGNNELEWYLPQNVQISDGTLKLIAQKQTVKASDGNTYAYTSGMVTTGKASSQRSDYFRFQFQYGYTEIRAKVPSGKGLWPAFWLLPTDNSAKPEIDVMEIIGDTPNEVNMTLHYKAGQDTTQEGNTWAGPDLSNGWHTYAVDWEPDHITWYVDGVERWTYTDTQNIPHKPMYLLLNLAVGGDWPGSPDATTVFPSTFEIDYVRVWAPG